jgi:hypothetical protein
MSDKQNLTLKCDIHFRTGRKGRLEMKAGQGATPIAPVPTGRVPKIARLMALAIKFDGMLQRGEVRDYADLARLGHVSRARVTQIMNLLNLATDIQEAILFLPATENGRDPLKEWMVRPVAGEAIWGRQRELENKLQLFSFTSDANIVRRRREPEDARRGWLCAYQACKGIRALTGRHRAGRGAHRLCACRGQDKCRGGGVPDARSQACRTRRIDYGDCCTGEVIMQP